METAIATNYPPYLDKDFFTICLREGLNNSNIEIKNFNITMGTNPGDNYTSFLYRVYIKYKDTEIGCKDLQLMVKSIPTDGDRTFPADVNLHMKEKSAYFDLLPQVHQLLRHCWIAPRCYYAVDTPVQTIVFQDLKAEGYSIADRVQGLNEIHCEIVLNKLAKFHAASAHILQKTPNLQEKFKEGFCCRAAVNTEVFQIFFRKNLKKAAEMVAEMPGFEHFGPQLMALFDNFPAIVLSSIALCVEDIRTVNHGDLWVNNIMFRYDNGTPNDALFVDFQGSFVNSPAFDLNYFFITSAQLPILKRKEEFIEKYYFPVFEDTLKNIGVKSLPTIEQILGEMRRHELFSLINLFGALPLISLEWEESKSNSHAQFVDESIASIKRNVGMSSERFIETMQYALKYYEKLNVFENAMKAIK
ncbi:unnamed protein product [Hermetia illucens]|uniref:CHK kinase-like domain-containing protein n=1 Tax=Hermetia illucens TaxID=343691 RepID=A0A7R8V3S8_HERIL|nr:uncharacterized protein LOC119657744 isoform X1 [Hermetia illucens]CAD7091482.1 unnamed protein product [Hermetia illucens]